ncbi:ATP-binding protein [Brevibacterium litoralis]|uniref:ATP-binding protein n=1 Tax=Brevibacterium litoralis TaxID=3138935 RepID=UPI0032EE78C5
MRTWSRPERRRTLLLLMPGFVVLLCVVATTVAAGAFQVDNIRESTTLRVRDVATSFARLDQVRTDLETANEALSVAPEDHRDLQDLASLVERASGVTYVVVVDMDERRLTHPDPEEVGEKVLTDTSPLYTGEEYVGIDTGPVGRTLRIKVPVFAAEGEVIGMVAVGILESRLADRYEEALRELLPWEIGALVVGLAASSAISFSLLRRFRRTDEDARELDTTRRITAALREQSHEFDTRIHVIRGLLAHGDTRDALEYVEEISGSADTDADDWAGDTRPPLLRATLDALRAELAAAGTTLDVGIGEVPEIDQDVTLVLANLCRNAAEAGAGRVRVRLEAGAGRLGGEVSADGHVLTGSVEDDGPGIRPADLDRIFRRGFSTKTDRDDTVRGIGLDMVRRTVATRGGTLEVGRSDLGGARFDFTLGAHRRVGGGVR